MNTSSRRLDFVFINLGHVRVGSIRNMKNNWNNASKRLFGSYSYSGIPGFPFQLFCSQEQNSRNIIQNIFLFQNIPNERALSYQLQMFTFTVHIHLECHTSLIYGFLYFAEQLDHLITHL